MVRQLPNAFETGVRALARRELTTTELIERIARTGIDRDDAANAAEALREAGYQSDERAARERARVLVSRGLGNTAVDADLRRRGLATALRATIVDELPPERDRAEELARRMGAGPGLLRALLRKGYDDEVARAVAGAPVADEP